MKKEKWIKKFNKSSIEIELVKVESGYQAMFKGKPITKCDASLDSARETLWGNGCVRETSKNTTESKVVVIPDRKQIDWTIVMQIILDTPEKKEEPKTHGFFENVYDGLHVQYWMSSKNYCYRQSEISPLPKRISESDYMSAYEDHYDL